MTTSIQFKSGINIVCFNSTESFTKLFGTSITKVNSISKIKNNLINTSIIVGTLVIGSISSSEYFTGYNVNCNDSFSITFSKNYETNGKVKLDNGINIIGISNLNNISIGSVFKSNKILSITKFDNNVISTSIYISGLGYVGPLQNLKNHEGYIISTSDSTTIDLYEDSTINLSINYDKIKSSDEIIFKIYKTNADIEDSLLISRSQLTQKSNNLIEYNPMAEKCNFCMNREARIVGGYPIDHVNTLNISNFEYRFTVSIHLSTTVNGSPYNDHWCGGSILNDKYILSAAHCWNGESPNDITIYAGILNRTDMNSNAASNKIYQVEEVIIMDNYISTSDGKDIALLKVKGTIDLSDPDITTIDLATNEDVIEGKLDTGTTCYTIGWGKLSSGGSSPNKLRYVDLKLTSNTDNYGSAIKSDMIIAGKLDSNDADGDGEIDDTVGGQDACQGDSGGPLIIIVDNVPKIIGVTSWGIGCGLSGYPGVWASVPYYSNWIMNKINDDIETNLIRSFSLDSNVLKSFSLPHGIYNFTIEHVCKGGHTEGCGSNLGTFELKIGNNVIVNQINRLDENTITTYLRYDSTFLTNSLTFGDYIVNLEAKLKNINSIFPDITEYESIGKSADGNYDLYALRISGNLADKTNKPSLKYSSNMHGDEVGGRAMLIWFAEWLCEEYYEGNRRVVQLLNNSVVHLIPTINPWGFHQVSRNRYNAYGVDLNRDFPDHYKYPNKTISQVQQETRNIMNYVTTYDELVLAANFHEGARIISYPYDGDVHNVSGVSGTPNESPDDYLYFCKKYSQNMNPKLVASNSYPSNQQFGSMNGADWYTIFGGMQDWEYVYHDIMSITIETSVLKNRSVDTLYNLRKEHLTSNDSSLIDGGAMMTFFEQAFQGVHGKVYDINNSPISEATIQLYSNGSTVYGRPVKSKLNGNFYKMAPPGDYTINISKTGYTTYTNNISIKNIYKDITKVTKLNVTLT